MHNTDGNRCEKCKIGFYRNMTLPFDHPDTCIKCKCNIFGTKTLNESVICDSDACICKNNVQGVYCDQCKNGYWNLSSSNQEDGCTKCKCHAEGTIDNLGCNNKTGTCLACKVNVHGDTCDKCKPGYFNLSRDNPLGCEPCNCHESFSYSKECDLNGECSCKPHAIGKKCAQIETDYFCPRLDHQTFEAENAERLDDNSQISERTETKSFIRVFENAQLKFHLRNILTTGIYDIYMRFEANCFRWRDIRVKLVNKGFDYNSNKQKSVKSIGNTRNCSYFNRGQYPVEYNEVFLDFSNKTSSELLFKGYCFEDLNFYELELTFKHDLTDLILPTHNSLLNTPSMLIDSIVLIPNIINVPREHLKAYKSCKNKYINTPGFFDEFCAKLICNLLIDVYGMFPCNCDSIGSFDKPCNPYGGQCHCKSNVLNINCNHCISNHWGFDQNGCKACNCDPTGAINDHCDLVTGQCYCHAGYSGKKCSECSPGYSGFPNCKKCQCNGFSSTCTADGICMNCMHNTDGFYCERCKIGYYGEPSLGIPCRKCSCPGINGNNFANSCYLKNNFGSFDLECKCFPGYNGQRCERCQSFYYGNPLKKNGSCSLCSCNGNIDPNDAENCDTRTGQCKNCLFFTEGFNCERCKEGFFGNASKQQCKPCGCNQNGTENHCETNCDRESGICRCLPNVIGHKCDGCASGYWGLESAQGCIPCNCDLTGTVQNSSMCGIFNGQCECLENRSGRKCDLCADGMFGDPKNGCKKCKCDSTGTLNSICDKKTGECVCRPGIGGKYCDYCSRGAIGVAPFCQKCGECFENWDGKIYALKLDLMRLEKEATEKFLEFKEAGEKNVYTKFYPQFESLELKFKDIKLILSQDYDNDNINITNMSKNLTLINSTFLKIKKEFNKKLAILNKWLEDKTLEEKKKEFHLVNNQTNDLLEDALNFRDSFYDGVKHSIDYSNEISQKSLDKLNKEMKDFNIEMNEIMPEIKYKTLQIKSVKEGANLTDIHSSFNRTIIELNIQLCGDSTCNRSCDLTSQCSEGLYNTYKLIKHINQKDFKQKETNLKVYLSKMSTNKINLMSQLEDIITLNKSLNDTTYRLKQFKQLISNLSANTFYHSKIYSIHLNQIEQTVNETLLNGMNSSLEQLRFNDNIELIKTLSTKDLNEKVDAIKSNTKKIVQDLSVLNEQLNEQHELKEIYENRTNKNLILIDQSDHTFSQIKNSLFNLTDTNNKISHFNSNSNKTLKNIKTKLNEIHQKQSSLEEKLKETNDFKININSNKIIQSGRILNKASQTLKDLKEKLQSFLNNVMHLNSLNGSNGNEFERLVELNKKILKKKQYIEQKEEKLKDLRDLNLDLKSRINKKLSNLFELKTKAFNLKNDILKELKLKKCSRRILF